MFIAKPVAISQNPSWHISVLPCPISSVISKDCSLKLKIWNFFPFPVNYTVFTFIFHLRFLKSVSWFWGLWCRSPRPPLQHLLVTHTKDGCSNGQITSRVISGGGLSWAMDCCHTTGMLSYKIHRNKDTKGMIHPWSSVQLFHLITLNSSLFACEQAIVYKWIFISETYRNLDVMSIIIIIMID